MRTESDLRAALDEMAAQAPAVHGRSSRRSRRRAVPRNNRRRAVVIAVAVGAGAVALASTWSALGPGRDTGPTTPPPTVATPGAVSWVMTYRVTPPNGWRISQEEIYRDTEQTLLSPTGSTGPGVRCSVVVDRSRDVGAPTPGTEVELGGRRGTFVPATPEQEATFRWRENAATPIEATCGGVADPRALVGAVVQGVRADRHDVKVPVTITGLPAGLEVKTVYGGGTPGDTEGVDIGDTSEPESKGRIGVVVQDVDPLQPQGWKAGRQITVAGRTGIVIAEIGSLCFPGRPTVCVADTEADGQDSGTPSAEVEAVFAALQPTGRLADRSTWPAAAEALPQ